MASDGSEWDARLRGLHGTMRSLTDEVRERLVEATEEAAAARMLAEANAKRLDAIEAASTRLAQDVAKLLQMLGSGEGGSLSAIRQDVLVLQGELALLRDRVADSEMSLLDAVLSPRSSLVAAGEGPHG